MRQILRKISSKQGESLVESLCAVLIFTMASVAMYSMVVSSANINATAKEVDQKFQTEMLVAEKAEGEGEPGVITMTIIPDGQESGYEVPVDVDIYRSDKNGALYSYFKSPEQSAEEESNE